MFGFIIKIWWGKSWNMHKRAFQALKRTFMHFPGLTPPNFDKKNQILYKIVLLSNYGGKSWNMHKRAFQALKRTFMHFPGLTPPNFDKKKPNTLQISFVIKIWWGSPETCINVRFRHWNAGLCMFQVFPYHIL